MDHQSRDILGHEFTGEVVEVGSKVEELKVGDRLVATPPHVVAKLSFPISCGKCFFCQTEVVFSL